MRLKKTMACTRKKASLRRRIPAATTRISLAISGLKLSGVGKA